MLFRQCALENHGSGYSGSGSPLSNIIFSNCAEIYEIKRKSENPKFLCSCVLQNFSHNFSAMMIAVLLLGGIILHCSHQNWKFKHYQK